MTYEGQVKGGVIVLQPGTALPEGMLVRVVPLAAAESLSDGMADPLFSMGERAVATGISDLATNAVKHRVP